MNTDNSLSLNNTSAGIYTDFGGLAKLRGQATAQSAEANKEVSQQLEAMFLQIMLKSMRDASQLSEATDGDQTRFYQDMFDKQIALDLASGQGIGLAAVIERQLGGTLNDTNPTQQTLTPKSFANVIEQHWKPDSEETFIRDLWPLAVEITAELDLAPEVLIAQSALETGWGQKVIKDSQGQSSLNLFGIKADERWQGDHVKVKTLEYRDGVARQEHASFRSYASRFESMSDYLNFLQENPRYQQALKSTSDSETFVSNLHKAGYATDPVYAEKISTILQRDSFVETIADLKASQASTESNYRF